MARAWAHNPMSLGAAKSTKKKHLETRWIKPKPGEIAEEKEKKEEEEKRGKKKKTPVETKGMT